MQLKCSRKLRNIYVCLRLMCYDCLLSDPKCWFKSFSMYFLMQNGDKLYTVESITVTIAFVSSNTALLFNQPCFQYDSIFLKLSVRGSAFNNMFSVYKGLLYSTDVEMNCCQSQQSRESKNKQEQHLINVLTEVVAETSHNIHPNFP